MNTIKKVTCYSVPVALACLYCNYLVGYINLSKKKKKQIIHTYI